MFVRSFVSSFVRSFVLPSVTWNLRQSFALKFLKWCISQQLLIRKHSYLDHSYPGGLAFTPWPRTPGSMPRGGARGRNLGHLKRCIFSSPEPKARRWAYSIPMVRRPSVVRRTSSVVVHNFKHEYLCNQWASCNQILSEASLGWGKGCIRFWARSDQNSGFHGNRKLP